MGCGISQSVHVPVVNSVCIDHGKEHIVYNKIQHTLHCKDCRLRNSDEIVPVTEYLRSDDWKDQKKTVENNVDIENKRIETDSFELSENLKSLEMESEKIGKKIAAFEEQLIAKIKRLCDGLRYLLLDKHKEGESNIQDIQQQYIKHDSELKELYGDFEKADRTAVSKLENCIKLEEYLSRNKPSFLSFSLVYEEHLSLSQDQKLPISIGTVMLQSKPKDDSPKRETKGDLSGVQNQKPYTSQQSQTPPVILVLKKINDETEGQGEETVDVKRSFESSGHNQETPTSSRPTWSTKNGTARPTDISMRAESPFSMTNAIIQVNEIDLSPLDERSYRNITHSAILPNYDMVLCDRKRQELLLLDKNFKTKDTVQLEHSPHNICIDNKHVVMTFPEDELIGKVRINPDKTFGNPSCFPIMVGGCRQKVLGISCFWGDLLLSTENGYIYRGHYSSEFEFEMVNYNYCLNLNPTSFVTKGDMVYICEKGKTGSIEVPGRLSVIDLSELKEKPLTYSEGVSHPTSCDLDSIDSIYICDKTSTIHKVSEDCQASLSIQFSTNFVQGNSWQHIKFLNRENDHNGENDRFILTEENSNILHVCQLIYTNPKDQSNNE